MIITDTLNATITTLLSGVCENAFGMELGYSHYNNQVYGFEDRAVLWTAWDGEAPIPTKEESLCGRHSLYVSIVCL